MGAFIQSEDLLWMLARLMAGILITVVVIAVIVLLGRPCRFEAMYFGLIWGGGLGPALSAALFLQLRRREWPKTVLRFVLVGAVSLFAMLIVVPNTTGAIQRGRRVKTMADMRELARQIEAGATPATTNDPWGNAYVTTIAAGGYTIVSYGQCGEPDIPQGQAYPEGPINSADCDVVYSNGKFLRYPGAESP
jgi:hypothetical protein